MADRSLAGGHPVALNKEFPEDRFEQKIKSFCSALRQHLETTDREANWDPDYYAELEAEVEVVSSAGIVDSKRVVDLQAALRGHHKTQSFLLLGDPGGGKSVALRKLAKVMLDEVDMTHRVPIYLNLREWLPKHESQAKAWTQENPPSKQDLMEFVTSNLKARGDVFTEEFVDTYFKDLWQKGQHLPRVDDALQESITRYLLLMPTLQFWFNYRSLQFSLSRGRFAAFSRAAANRDNRPDLVTRMVYRVMLRMKELFFQGRLEAARLFVGVLLIIGVIRIWATSSNRLGETAGNETGWLTFPLSSALSGVRSGLVLVTLAVLIMNWRPFWLLVSGVFRRPWHMIQLFGAFCVGSAGADEAMTELAKLEERWLKLDR